MRFAAFLGVVIALAMCADGTASAQSPDLTEAEAKRILEASWNRQVSYVGLGTKLLQDVEQNYACNDTRISQSQFAATQGAERAGLVKIVRDSKDKNQVVISPAARGLEADLTGKDPDLPKTRDCLRMRIGSFQLTEVARNELQRVGATHHRVLHVSYAANYNPAFKEMMEAAGQRLSDLRKAIVLLKHDATTTKWTIVTFDSANQADEFRSTRVRDALAAAGRAEWNIAGVKLGVTVSEAAKSLEGGMQSSRSLAIWQFSTAILHARAFGGDGEAGRYTDIVFSVKSNQWFQSEFSVQDAIRQLEDKYGPAIQKETVRGNQGQEKAYAVWGHRLAHSRSRRHQSLPALLDFFVEDGADYDDLAMVVEGQVAGPLLMARVMRGFGAPRVNMSLIDTTIYFAAQREVANTKRQREERIQQTPAPQILK